MSVLILKNFFKLAIPLLLMLGLLVVATSTTAFASHSLYFTEAFDGPTAGPNLEDADSAFTVSGGVIMNTAGATPIEANRHSVRTLRTDYNTDDWTYTIDFDISGSDIIYIGLGSGEPDGGWLGEPGNSIHFRIHSLSMAGGVVHVMTRGASTGSPGWDDIKTLTPLPADGPFTARIVKSGSDLTFSIDGLAGSEVVTIPGFLNNTNSRLFFGDGGPATSFDNMVVTPILPDLPDSKSQCKKGGWEDYGVFKNQGDCVSFVATNGKNPPAN